MRSNSRSRSPPSRTRDEDSLSAFSRPFAPSSSGSLLNECDTNREGELALTLELPFYLDPPNRDLKRELQLAVDISQLRCFEEDGHTRVVGTAHATASLAGCTVNTEAVGTLRALTTCAVSGHASCFVDAVLCSCTHVSRACFDAPVRGCRIMSIRMPPKPPRNACVPRLVRIAARLELANCISRSEASASMAAARAAEAAAQSSIVDSLPSP